MRNRLVLTASVFLAGVSSLPAYAQSYYNDYNGTVVRCESREGRTERCNASGGDVQLVRQLSGSPCVRGRNWGTDSRGIWVSSGCRAEFRVQSGDYDDYGDYDGYDDYDDDHDDDRYGNGYGNRYGNNYGNEGLFRCESSNNRTERCSSSGGRAEFVRQLSNTPCVRGQSWGTDSRGVWVSNGCRAMFRTGGYGNGYGNNNGGYNNDGHGGSDLIRCESNDNRSHSCSFSTTRGGEIRLLRQLSGKPCVENQTWGRSRNGVWVTQGCRAEFVIGRGNGGGNWRPPGANLRPPGDLGGGIPSGKQPETLQPGVFRNTSGQEEARRPPAQTVIERPRHNRDDQNAPLGRQIRPVEETQPVAPGRPAEQPLAQAEPRNTGGSAQPGVVEQAPAPREEPAPRKPERTVERGERPH